MSSSVARSLSFATTWRASTQPPQSLYRIERIGEAVPTGGRRHELCDTSGSLRADSLRIEATFLPDNAGKELYWKGVLRRRLF
jgi:hypothetical protein